MRCGPEIRSEEPQEIVAHVVVGGHYQGQEAQARIMLVLFIVPALSVNGGGDGTVVPRSPVPGVACVPVTWVDEGDVANNLVPDLVPGGAVGAPCVAAGETDHEVPPLLRALQGRCLRGGAQVAEVSTRDDLVPNGVVRVIARGCRVKSTQAAEPVLPEEVRPASALAVRGVHAESVDAIAGVLVKE